MKNEIFFWANMLLQACLILVIICVIRADLPDPRMAYFTELVLLFQTWFGLDELIRWRVRRQGWRVLNGR